MAKIYNIHDCHSGLNKAINYFHKIWGNAKNFNFYDDALRNAKVQIGLPQFYVLEKQGEIIGISALITNDFISRQDLFPWFACFYVEPNERNKGYGTALINYALNKAKQSGFNIVYLTTEHENLYERFGWKRMENGIDLFSGEPTRIYFKNLD